MQKMPSILARVKDKTDTYSPMVDIARRQSEQRKRSNVPKFVPFVMSTSGGFGSEARALIDSIVSAYSEHSLACHGWYDWWGHSLPARIHRFKKQFEFDLQRLAIMGAAKSQSLVGLPWEPGSKKVYGNSL